MHGHTKVKNKYTYYQNSHTYYQNTHTPTYYYELQSRDQSPSRNFVSHLSCNVPDHCREHHAVAIIHVL
jgi:hypothetical protein